MTVGSGRVWQALGLQTALAASAMVVGSGAAAA
jgi:hypothetical protein